jgi:hypothetical protein
LFIKSDWPGLGISEYDFQAQARAPRTQQGIFVRNVTSRRKMHAQDFEIPFCWLFFNQPRGRLGQRQQEAIACTV